MSLPKDKRNADLRSACPSGKRRFRTEQAARNALERDIQYRAEGSSSRRETRVYWCHRCDGWHLTSQPVKPLSARSSAIAEVYRQQRRPLVAALLTEFPSCQARIDGVCVGVAQDVHEVKSRARGGSITDRTNCMTVCRPCHTWITDHPAAAQRLGYSKHSWEQ